MANCSVCNVEVGAGSVRCWRHPCSAPERAAETKPADIVSMLPGTVGLSLSPPATEAGPGGEVITYQHLRNEDGTHLATFAKAELTEMLAEARNMELPEIPIRSPYDDGPVSHVGHVAPPLPGPIPMEEMSGIVTGNAALDIADTHPTQSYDDVKAEYEKEAGRNPDEVRAEVRAKFSGKGSKRKP